MIASHPSLNNDNGNCVVMQTTTQWARQFISTSSSNNNDNKNEEDDSIIMVQPLLDIMKIHPGTTDMVTSSGWKVPFRHRSDNNNDIQSSSTLPLPQQHNASETIQNWE